LKRKNFKFFIFPLFLTFLFLSSFVFTLLFLERFNFGETSSPELNIIRLSTPTSHPIDEIKIVFTGDVMLGRSVMVESLERGDPLFPFRNVANILKDADITFVNLENPIIKNCPRQLGGFTFCASYEVAEGLFFSGVDVVTLANNHALNYGEKGLVETIRYLDERGILATGVGKLVTKEVGGITFGFLGFDKSQESNPRLEEDEVELIRESDSKVDFLIIAMHWGFEYQDEVLSGVRDLAFDLIKEGADAVVGHHPHWVQGKECVYKEEERADVDLTDGWIYNNDYHLISKKVSRDNLSYPCPPGSKPIFYSLGNFIFDQMWSEETKKGVIVELTLEDGKFVGDKVFKTYIRQSGQPEVLFD